MYMCDAHVHLYECTQYHNITMSSTVQTKIYVICEVRFTNYIKTSKLVFGCKKRARSKITLCARLKIRFEVSNTILHLIFF